MSYDDRQQELCKKAAVKLQILVKQLILPFTEKQITTARQEWEDAGRELEAFREAFVRPPTSFIGTGAGSREVQR